MKFFVTILTLVALSHSVNAVVVTKEQVIDLCHATGKLILNGLAPISVSRTLKESSALNDLQDPTERSKDMFGSFNGALFNGPGSGVLDAVIDIFVEGINRITTMSATLPAALAQDISNLKQASVQEFCKQVPLPDTIDFENPVTALTDLANFVDSLNPANDQKTVGPSA